MNCHSHGLYPGCCRNCPKLAGVKLPELKPQPAMPAPRAVPMPVYIPPAPPIFVPAMAEIPPAQMSIPVEAPAALLTQPEGGKVVVEPTTTAEAENGPQGHEAELAAFLAENPKKGTLRIQTFRGQQILPVPGVHVVISRTFADQQHIFFEGDTDQSGILDGIILPAAPRDRSLDPGEPLPSATYDLLATHPQYQDLKTAVDIYQDIQTTQLIQMLLKPEG